MEHSVDCRRPDVFDSVEYQSCLNCGSVYYENSTGRDRGDDARDGLNSSASKPTGEEKDHRPRYTTPHYCAEESSSASVESPGLGGGHLATHSSERFRYRPINQREELRLLRIQQALSFEDPIQCTLLHESLRQVLPPFEAISYTWADESGNSAKQGVISLDSKSFRITTNCERALRRIRLKSRSRLVWIDAICINQESETEKTHQVQLMAQIYARATRVLIYVGEAKNQSGRLLEILGDPRNGEHECDSTPYFWRVWVLQEVALAKQAYLICGDNCISWGVLAARDTIKLLSPGLKLHPSHLLSKPKVLQVLRAFQLHQGSFLATLPPALGFKRPMVRDIPQLLPLLDTSSFCDASDPRDKVYALLGLVTGLEPLGFFPDYSETVEDIYVDVAVLLAQICGPVATLTRAVCRPSVSRRRSWVPDWRHPPGYVPTSEQYDKMKKCIAATKHIKQPGTSSTSSKTTPNCPENMVRQDVLQIRMSLVCTMYDLLLSGGMLGMVDVRQLKISILPADDTANGPIDLDVYPGVQYSGFDPNNPSGANGKMIAADAAIWLKRLAIYAPWPTSDNLQNLQRKHSRLDILGSQCLVLLEHTNTPCSKGPSTSTNSTGSGSTISTPAPSRMRPGVFKGLCMLSISPGPTGTSQTHGFWYQKGFISDNNFINTKEHRLGWHKQQMKSMVDSLVDLKNYVVDSSASIDKIPDWQALMFGSVLSTVGDS